MSNRTDQSKWKDVCPILLSVVASRGSKVEETKQEQNPRQERGTHFNPTAALSHSVWSTGIPLHNTWEDFCPSILPTDQFSGSMAHVVNLTETSHREPDKLSTLPLKETYESANHFIYNNASCVENFSRSNNHLDTYLTPTPLRLVCNRCGQTFTHDIDFFLHDYTTHMTEAR